MSKSDFDKLTKVFFVVLFAMGFSLGGIVCVPLAERYGVPSQPQPWIATVWGYVSDYVSKQPLAGVHVMAFGGNAWYLETPYISSVFDAYTDSQGFYIIEVPTLMHTIDSHAPPRGKIEVTASLNADTYLIPTTNPVVLSSSDAQSFQPGTIDRWQIQCNLSLAVIIQNVTNNTSTWAQMTSTVFDKLDYSYIYWNLTTDPDIYAFAGSYEVLGGHGNNTQVIIQGLFPSHVDVTFFNGTNIATTRYYPVLQYWTDPIVVKGEEP